MSVDLFITAFTPETDAEFQKHRKVLIVCHEACVSLPQETAMYFNTPNSLHPCLTLLDEKLKIRLKEDVHYKKIPEEQRKTGYEIDLEKLPAGVNKIRVWIS